MRRRIRTGPAASGFTLLELVVALALTTLLVTAIYGSLRLYVRISTEDTTQLEHSRLARALFRQMSLDIRSVVFQPPESSGQAMEGDSEADTGTDETGSGTENMEESGTSESGSLSTSEESAGVTSVGLIGDSIKLVLHVSRPSRDLEYESIQSGTGLHARTSDLQSITYFLADPNSSGMEGEVGRAAAPGGLGDSRSQQPQGLARLVGDEFAVNFADTESNTSMLASSAKIIAPEVVSIDFQYFDGLSWQASWDSIAMGRLPNAVAVTIGLARIPTEEEEQEAQRNRRVIEDSGKIIETRRHVVALPLADPIGGEL